MDTDPDDVWSNWLGLSSHTIQAIQKSQKGKKSLKRKSGVSPVEEHIKSLTESLSKTQAALEKAGQSEKLAREQHQHCSENLTRQGIENSNLQEQVVKLCQEVEECRARSDGQVVVNTRLKERLHELVRMVREVEKEAGEYKYLLENEQRVHLAEKEELREVHAAHEDCLASLKAAQESLAGYQDEVATRNGIIQSLKRHKTGISTKLTHFSTSLRRTSTELDESQKNLAQVAEQFQEAEKVIQQQSTMISSLEEYKQQLLEETASLRNDYEDRTMQLVRMRETLLERNGVISDLRDQLEQRDSQLRFYDTRTAFIRRELVDANTELAESKSAVARAGKTIDALKGSQDVLREEKDREIAALCTDKVEMKTALAVSQAENEQLRSDLEGARARLAEKDEKLAEETAAHMRTAEAAAAQKLRLQSSIDDLKKSLAVTESDLEQARKTLFALNAKCLTVSRAQSSLAKYQRREELLIDHSTTTLERHDSGMEVDTEQSPESDTTSLESTNPDTNLDQGPDKQCTEQRYGHARKVDMRKVKARQEVIKSLRSSALSHRLPPDSSPRGPNSIFEPLNLDELGHSNFSRPLTPTPRGGSLRTKPALSAVTRRSPRASADAPASNTRLSPLKRVRFAIADEGYQTDEMRSPLLAVSEERSTNSEAQECSTTDEVRSSFEVVPSQAVTEEFSTSSEMRSFFQGVPLQAVPEESSMINEMGPSSQKVHLQTVPEKPLTINELRSSFQGMPLQAVPEELSAADERPRRARKGSTGGGRVWDLIRDLEKACTGGKKTLKRRKSRDDLRFKQSLQ